LDTKKSAIHLTEKKGEKHTDARTTKHCETAESEGFYAQSGKGKKVQEKKKRPGGDTLRRYARILKKQKKRMEEKGTKKTKKSR